MKTVYIYLSPIYHFCHMTKDFFTGNNIQFTDYDVATNPSATQEVIAKSGQMGVPVIDVIGKIIVGFNDPELRTLLNIA